MCEERKVWKMRDEKKVHKAETNEEAQTER